jgi:hypothetical protein
MSGSPRSFLCVHPTQRRAPTQAKGRGKKPKRPALAEWVITDRDRILAGRDPRQLHFDFYLEPAAHGEIKAANGPKAKIEVQHEPR